jgi:hypothetical protein
VAVEVRSADGTPLAVWAGGQGPPLVLPGVVGLTDEDVAAAAIPGARVQVLEGHAHLAHRTDPAVGAAAIRGSSCPDPLSG